MCTQRNRHGRLCLPVSIGLAHRDRCTCLRPHGDHRVEFTMYNAASWRFLSSSSCLTRRWEGGGHAPTWLMLYQCCSGTNSAMRNEHGDARRVVRRWGPAWLVANDRASVLPHAQEAEAGATSRSAAGCTLPKFHRLRLQDGQRASAARVSPKSRTGRL